MDGFEKTDLNTVDTDSSVDESEINQPDSYYVPQDSPAQNTGVYHAAPGEYYDLPLNQPYQGNPFPAVQGAQSPYGAPANPYYQQPAPAYSQQPNPGFPQGQPFGGPVPQGYPQPQPLPQSYPQPQPIQPVAQNVYQQPVAGYYQSPVGQMLQPGYAAQTGSYYDPSPSVGRNVVCMVFGILALFVSFAFFDEKKVDYGDLGIQCVFLILSVVFGILGITGKTKSKGMSIAGLICSGLGIILTIIFIAGAVH